MDAFEADRQHGANAQQALALGRPVARRAGAEALARQQHDGLPGPRVAGGRVPDGFDPAAGRVPRMAHRRLGAEQVDKALAVERGPHHDLPIAPARREDIQIVALVAALDQEVGDQAVRGNGAGGRQVVRGYVVAQHQQRMRRVAAQLAGFVEGREGRAAQRRGRRIPGEARRIGRLQRLPGRVGAGDLERPGVVRGPLAGGQRGVDLRLVRPEVAQVDGAAVRRDLHGLLAEVALGVACQRERDDQRRRHQEAQVEVRMDAAREIAVAGQHRDGVHRAGRHGCAHGSGQGAGVADAGGAAVAHDVEAHGGQVAQQPGAGQVVRGGGRTRPQGCLHPGRHAQAGLAGLARQQARRRQQPRVGGVGTAGDGRDRDGVAGQAVRRRPGCEIQARQQGLRVGVGVQVLRPFGPRHMHPHAVQRNLDHPGIARRGVGIQGDAGAFGVLAHQRDVRFGPARLAQIGQRFAVDGEVARRGAVLRRHIGHHAPGARR
ncbi:hypothetical protein FQZ97_686080 [compost metagenome]